MTEQNVTTYLNAAIAFVTKSRELILDYAKRGFQTSVKEDTSFVTEADLGAERLLREQIQANFPTHGIVGEEMENTNPDAEFQWYIDPIDGTQNFAHGLPTYGTILGLHHNGLPIVGVVDHPALDLKYWAGKGLGAFCNGERISIRDTKSQELDVNEVILTSTRGMFERSGEGYLLDDFMRLHHSTRIYYDIFSTTQVAHGRAGALVEFNVRMWDLAASQILIEEAGGKFKIVRERTFADKPTMYSAIMGKPTVVDLLMPRFSLPMR